MTFYIIPEHDDGGVVCEGGRIGGGLLEGLHGVLEDEGEEPPAGLQILATLQAELFKLIEGLVVPKNRHITLTS